jgi:arylsulfatase A
MKLPALLLLPAVLSLCPLSQAQTAAPTKPKHPNILLLYADDLGYGDLRSYNPASKIPTPHLDRLASQGARFTDAHSSSGICSPSRHALLTGRYHWRDFHGIVDSFGPPAFQNGTPTLQEMLRQNGYHTACIGKWHLGWDWKAIRKPNAKPRTSGKQTIWSPDAFDWSLPIPGGPLDQGFDHYFGDDVINFPPYCWIEDRKVLQAPDTLMDTAAWKAIKEGNWECRPGPMATGWDPYHNLPETTRRGVEYIHARKIHDQPFFLYFAYPSPHAPIIPNDRFDGSSQAGPYGDFVHETDDSVGQLLRALEESGQAANTLVIFSADNGPEHYAYPRDKTFQHSSNHPLRGLKRDLYEGGHRVPLIARWPGTIPAGQVIEALVGQIDLMATLAHIIGHELPENAAIDSINLTPLFQQSDAAPRQTLIHNTHAGRYAIRQGDWLLIDGKDGYHTARNDAWEARHGYPADDKLPVELYDLKNDLAQKNNLAAQHPERVAKLQALLRQATAR